MWKVVSCRLSILNEQFSMNIPQLVLASASPARKRLLESAGFDPVVCPSNFDESQVQLSDPVGLVQTLALCKAETIAPRFSDALVLGCDSVLAVNGEIYGKPADPAQAIARWQIMSGRQGLLYTGHALIDVRNNTKVVKSQVTEVHFAQISDRAIAAYVATGEPLNCAGGFAIEGKGGLFVEKLVGCQTNVIGLSLPLLRQMLLELGYEATEAWLAVG